MKEIIVIIRKNILIFITIFLFCIFGGIIKILNQPIFYEYRGFFRYNGINPILMTEKKDINGTITLKKYEIGEDNLDFNTLFKSKEYKNIARDNEVKLEFNRGNGNYEIIIKGKNPNELNSILDMYFKTIKESNLKFLKNKLENENNIEIKNKILYEIINSERSFPLILKSDKVNKINGQKSIIILLFTIIGFLLGIIGVFIQEILEEVLKKK